MNQLNKVELVGIVGQVRQIAGCTRFSVATTYAYKAKGGSVVAETTWHNVISFNEINLQMGDYVHVIGRIKNQRYTDTNGEERYIIEIVAKVVESLDESPKFEE